MLQPEQDRCKMQSRYDYKFSTSPQMELVNEYTGTKGMRISLRRFATLQKED